jgi:hypothetical protein
MPEFISKLQHKTYEKGEFSDEKVRSFDETIDLIKAFPWDAERTLTDIQLTGPSVTIRDGDLNYLKVGLYFNGKYCLYYLDRDNHLYEYHASDINDACKIVGDFFTGQLDLEQFEKKFISVGSIKHFENALFDYTVNPAGFIARFIFAIILALLELACAVMMFKLNPPTLAWFTIVPLALFVSGFVFYFAYLQLRYYLKSKNLSLTLSAGNDIFQFGNIDAEVSYNKADIDIINVYGNTGTKGSHVLDIMEIIFIDGSKIQIPGMLIEPFTFRSKFLTNKIELFQKSTIFRKVMWQYAHSI